MSIPRTLHRHFWNCRVDELDTKQHKETIIETLLECGDLEAWQWLLRTYGQNDILPVLECSHSISPRSKSFWSVYFHIDLPDVHAREGTPWWDSQSTSAAC